MYLLHNALHKNSQTQEMQYGFTLQSPCIKISICRQRIMNLLYNVLYKIHKHRQHNIILLYKKLPIHRKRSMYVL